MGCSIFLKDQFRRKQCSRRSIYHYNKGCHQPNMPGGVGVQHLFPCRLPRWGVLLYNVSFFCLSAIWRSYVLDVPSRIVLMLFICLFVNPSWSILPIRQNRRIDNHQLYLIFLSASQRGSACFSSFCAGVKSSNLANTVSSQVRPSPCSLHLM